jgi:prepilin signal peptidase PulO-like enzyme (type II secretory pathway)
MLYFVLAIFGAVFGSFAAMASYRLIHHKSFFGYSKCDHCKHRLGFKDLIPIFSYLIQNAKCRYCKKHISPRNIITELLCTFGFMLIGINHHNDMFLLCLFSLMTTALAIMIIVDFEHYIIPDEIQIALAVLGIFYAHYEHHHLLEVFLMPAFSFLIGYTLMKSFKYLMKKDGLGFGDVKFFAVVGLYFNIEQLSVFFFISGIIGVCTAIVWRILGRGETFPFGPSLAMALYTILMFPGVEKFAFFLD